MSVEEYSLKHSWKGSQIPKERRLWSRASSLIEKKNFLGLKISCGTPVLVRHSIRTRARPRRRPRRRISAFDFEDEDEDEDDEDDDNTLHKANLNPRLDYGFFVLK